MCISKAKARLEEEVAKATLRRRRLWEVPDGFQCSILGTCLSLDKCARIIRKTTTEPLGQASDYDIHALAVHLAKTKTAAAKMLEKALDRAHSKTLARYNKVSDRAELRATWRADFRAGRVKGAYWAVMSHPLADPGLLNEAFGEIHMLSHKLGCSRREQLDQFQDLSARAEALERLLGTQREAHAQALAAAAAENEQLRLETRALERQRDEWMAQSRLYDEVAVARLRSENETLHRRLEKTQRGLDHALWRLEATRADRPENLANGSHRALVPKSSEAPVSASPTCPSRTNDCVQQCDLQGRCLLYVGGERRMHSHLTELAAAANGELLLHDGGLEDSLQRLPRLCARADVILCPVDRVSHAAVDQVKRACRNGGKTFVPLERSSLEAFEKGLVKAAAAASA